MLDKNKILWTSLRLSISHFFLFGLLYFDNLITLLLLHHLEDVAYSVCYKGAYLLNRGTMFVSYLDNLFREYCDTLEMLLTLHTSE